MMAPVDVRAFFGWVVASAGLVSCSKMDVTLDEPKPVPFEVQVNVVSDPGVPLANAQVLSGTKVVGTTAAAGVTKLRFGGNEGDQVDLTIKCPADYDSPSKPLSISLRRLRSRLALRRSSRPAARPRCAPWSSGCARRQRPEPAGHLPRSNDSRTDASGAALFIVRVKPAEQVQVTVSTAEPGAEMLQAPETRRSRSSPRIKTTASCSTRTSRC